MGEGHWKGFGVALAAFGVVVALFLPLAAWGSVTSSRLSALVIYAWSALPVTALAFWPSRHARLLNPLTLGLAGGLSLVLGALNGTYAAHGMKAVFSYSWWHLAVPFGACVIPFFLAGARRGLPRGLIPLSGAIAIAAYYLSTGRPGWIGHVNGHRAAGTPEIISLWGDLLGCLSLPVSLGGLLWLALVVRDERSAAANDPPSA